MKKSSRLSVALHALVHLGKQPGEPITSTTLAQCLMTNPVVVRRVLGQLREAELVSAARGSDGGWRLAQGADTITLGAVYAAMGETLIRTDSEPGDRGCGIVRAVDRLMGEVLDEAEAILARKLNAMTLAGLMAVAAPNPLHPHPKGHHIHG
jgi:Rrf2 family protein